MSDTASGSWPCGSEDVERAVLDRVLDRHPAATIVSELYREFTLPSLRQRISAVFVDDALVELEVAGLVHRTGTLVLATNAARTMARLRV